MPQFDFEPSIQRENTYSLKWNRREEFFGAKDILPMWVADMDFKAAPAIRDALQAEIEHGIFGYAYVPEKVYSAVQNWSAQRYAWQIQKDWLVFCPSLVTLISMLIHRFTQPDEAIIIQPPVYHAFEFVIHANHRQVLNNPLRLQGDQYEIDFADLERCLASGAKILILCHPHNPIGRVWTRAELQCVAELCAKYQTLIISDEVYADLTYPPQQHIPFASVTCYPNVITCMGPTKAFNLSGLQIAYLVIGNAELRQQVNKELLRWDATIPNLFGIAALNAAYTQGAAWLDALLVYLQANCDYVIEFLAAQAPAIRVIKPAATYLLWLDCRGLNLGDHALKEFFIQQAHLGLIEGNKFGVGGSGFMRLNVAYPRHIVAAALQKIAAACQGLRS